MHLDFISRGSKFDVDRFVSEISAKYVPIKIKDKINYCNIVYRPIQLGELIFPEEQLQTVLATLAPMNWKRKSMIFTTLRKLLNLEPVPEADGKTLPLAIYNKNIELNLLGIKRDVFKDGFENL